MERIDVAVVTALSEEAAPLRDEVELTPVDLGALPGGTGRCTRGVTDSGLTVVVLVTGAGRAAAAEGMGLFFSRFRPLLLIGGGIAGGIGASVHIGELVIPEETVCYDEDATALKMPLGTLRRGRSAMTPVAGDPRFREAVERIAEHNGFVVHRGGIASGDTLLNRRTLAALPENRRRLIESAHAVDMESSVWSDFAVRGDVPLVLTRFISDHVTAGDRLGFVHACESIGEILVQVLRSCRMGPDGAIVIE